VLLKVAHNGICGSDLHEYYSAPTFISTGPHPLTGVNAPVIMGHEFAGTVVAAGAGVDDTLVGRNAAARSTYSCGSPGASPGTTGSWSARRRRSGGLPSRRWARRTSSIRGRRAWPTPWRT
jgi:threonine dehydrogenase-like Zn-dependent dehydrogenase